VGRFIPIKFSPEGSLASGALINNRYSCLRSISYYHMKAQVRGSNFENPQVLSREHCLKEWMKVMKN